MAQGDVPEEVQRLLRDHISSVEQLEILLLFQARPEAVLDGRAVSDELRTSETSASSRIADLAQRGFLKVIESADQNHSYQYGPSDEPLRQAVELLREAYAERRYRIIELIFSKPIDNLRVYAGAFRFRKDDSNG